MVKSRIGKSVKSEDNACAKNQVHELIENHKGNANIQKKCN